jgi:hypothetical protein
MVTQDTATSGQSAEIHISDTKERTSSTSDKMVAQDAATSGQSAEIHISDVNEENA